MRRSESKLPKNFAAAVVAHGLQSAGKECSSFRQVSDCRSVENSSYLNVVELLKLAQSLAGLFVHFSVDRPGIITLRSKHALSFGNVFFSDERGARIVSPCTRISRLLKISIPLATADRCQ